VAQLEIDVDERKNKQIRAISPFMVSWPNSVPTSRNSLDPRDRGTFKKHTGISTMDPVGNSFGKFFGKSTN
jgi:hypothetical protein